MPLTKDEEKLKNDLYKLIQQALTDAGGLESNIGVATPYWDWVNQYRTLVAKSRE